MIAWPSADSVSAVAPPLLHSGAVHLWGWCLDGDMQSVTSEVLSHDETARAHRLTSESQRSRFVAAHCGVRLILARYLQINPEAIGFQAGEQGKPYLAGDSSIRFNLSHSRDVAVMAVSDGIEVGVDVEFLRPVSKGIAKRFFSASESAALAALPDAEQLSAFYSCWTRKEAFLKGRGTGLWGGLGSFVVSVQGAPRLFDDGSGITTGWNLEDLKPAVGYAGALAIKANTWNLSCFSVRL